MNRVIIIIFSCLAFASHAQVDSTTVGDVVDAEILIEKERTIRLPQSEKIRTNAVNNSQLINRPLELSFVGKEPSFKWPDYKSEVEVVPTNQKYPKATYQNSIKAGFGNYNSPLIALNYSQALGEAKIRVNAFHESFQSGPIEGENSSSSLSMLELTSTFKNERLQVTPFFSWKDSRYKFYGNTNRLNSGFTEQHLETQRAYTFSFGTRLTGSVNDITYEFGPEFRSTNQAPVNGQVINKESVIKVDGSLNLPVQKELNVGFEIKGNAASYEGGVDYNRSLFSLAPYLDIKKENLSAKAGLAIITNKEASNEAEIGLFPYIEAKWNVQPKFSIVGKARSGMQWNDLQSLLASNYFLSDSLTIRNTTQEMYIEGGIETYLTKNLQFSSGVSFSRLSNLPFFYPSTDSSQFTIIYDGGSTNRLTWAANVSYTPSASTTVGFKLSLHNYSTTSIDKAWHLPTSSYSFYFMKNFKEKFIITSEVIANGGIIAPNLASGDILELDSYVDINVNLEYKASDRFFVFLKLNNLLNNEYEKYIGYPVRGAAFKIGASYRF